ncbi:MAG: hypothetical protein ABIJ73_04465 [Pseudomonadota bacterium]
MSAPTRNWLVMNVGSATLKAAVYAVDGDGERAGAGRRVTIPLGDDTDVDAALSTALTRLPVAAQQPQAIVHRVVHGGRRAGAVVLTPEQCAELTALAPMAPLHQPPALALVELAARRWPQARQFAAFDTSWHAHLAPWSRRLPLPQGLHAAGVMRYGFHGLAYQSAWRQLKAQAPALAHRRLVMAHLGGGSSLCAVHHGRSIDTTMGLTPLDGVPMATRSGSLDPGVIGYLTHALRMPWPEIEQVLWRESGLKGLSGLSGDMRELQADPGEAAALAREHYARRVAQAIAAMATSLGGVDAIVFSGGIGAGAAAVRAQIAASLRWMGVELDPEANQRGGLAVHADHATVSAWVFHVNEEDELLEAALAEERA